MTNPGSWLIDHQDEDAEEDSAGHCLFCNSHYSAPHKPWCEIVSRPLGGRKDGEE